MEQQMEPLQIDENGQVILPQPDELARRSKDDAMGSYLMMFGSIFVAPIPLINVAASWIYYMIFRKKDRFAAFHALQSFLSQILVSVLNMAVIIALVHYLFSFITEIDWQESESVDGGNSETFGLLWNSFFQDENRIYLFLAFVLFVGLCNLFYIVYSLIGAVRAHKGQMFYMPFFGPLSFDCFYGNRAKVHGGKKSLRNLPPKGY